MNILKSNKQATGLHLVKHVAKRVIGNHNSLQAIREGSTGRVVVMLPRVWAVAETAVLPEPMEAVVPLELVAPVEVATPLEQVAPPERMMGVEIAFYRKYTEAMLRRYLKLSMAAGRVPSLLGRELFRGHVSSYRVQSFEDAVIFCFDIEKCLNKLDAQEKELIKRITLQAYSQGEAAAMMGISMRNCIRLYAQTLDHLTRVLLRARLLDPQKCCQ